MTFESLVTFHHQNSSSMERLKTQNLHFKRVLDRQLTDLESRHRHSEQKRQREVRSLGLDLAKLQKSTRDVDEILSNSPTTFISIDDAPITSTPRTSTPRRASFAGFSLSNSRPLTSPALPSGRRSSVTSSVANLLSRSRQELTSLSLTPSPRGTSRRHSVFDFRLQQQQQQQQRQENITRKSSLPELKHSDSFDNITTNNNNNNHKNSIISSNTKHNINSNNSRTDSINKTKSRPASIQRRHSSADISVTIHVLNNNVNKNTNNGSIITTTNNNNNTNNNNSSSIVTKNKNNDTIKRTMTVGTERRDSNPAISTNTTTQSTRRRSSGSLGIPANINNNINNNNKHTIQDSTRPPMAGKSPTRLMARRGSSDSASSGSSPTMKKCLQKLSLTSSEEVSHNETVVLVHRDDDEPEVVSPDIPGAGSMFYGPPKRRASEPALGGQLLWNLQNKVKEAEKEGKASHGSNGNGGNGIPLRQAIEEELPSGIVAEEDEDRYNEEAEEELKKNGGDTGSEKNTDKKDGHTLNKPSVSSDLSLSSSSSSVSSTKGTGTKKSSKENGKKSETGDKSGKARSQTRRKSEGDVLRFARIWRLHAGNNESMKGLFDDDDEEDKAVKTPPESKDDIWNAVRKCRYIRGHEPTDMAEPSDLGEYVFGHQSKESSLATK